VVRPADESPNEDTGLGSELLGVTPADTTLPRGMEQASQSFWSSMQIELLNRRRWKTRVELANAIFEYIEIFHNRQRRHSALGYRTPIEGSAVDLVDSGCE
jgi:transposase InsO family protein